VTLAALLLSKREGQHRSHRIFKAVKTPRINQHPPPINALTLHTPVLPPLPEPIRRLVNAVYATHGGAEHMSLDAWRDVEHELKQRLENEHQQPQ